MRFIDGIRSAFVAGYKGPSNDHFNGERFTTTTPLTGKSLMDGLKMALARQNQKPVAQVARIRDIRQTHRRRGARPFTLDVCESCVLADSNRRLKYFDGSHLVKKCRPTSWLGPRRVRAPGVRLEDLPRIDAVLISHNHYVDHLDNSLH